MHRRFSDEQAVQVLKAVSASPSPVGKPLSAQVWKHLEGRREGRKERRKGRVKVRADS